MLIPVTKEIQRVNPLCPNISMLILHTALYTFPVLLIRRSCLTIISLLSGWLFPVFLTTLMFHSVLSL